MSASVSVLASPDAFYNFPAGMTIFEKRIPLNQPTLLHFPRYEPLPYLITFTIPYWLKELYIEGWQYSGEESDSITRALTEINQKIDGLQLPPSNPGQGFGQNL